MFSLFLLKQQVVVLSFLCIDPYTEHPSTAMPLKSEYAKVYHLMI